MTGNPPERASSTKAMEGYEVNRDLNNALDPANLPHHVFLLDEIIRRGKEAKDYGLVAEAARDVGLIYLDLHSTNEDKISPVESKSALKQADYYLRLSQEAYLQMGDVDHVKNLKPYIVLVSHFKENRG